MKNSRITALPHKQSMGLQIADAVAGSFFRAVEFLHGFTEDRYIAMLRPVIYKGVDGYLGYGIVLVPEDITDSQPESCAWIGRIFK